MTRTVWAFAELEELNGEMGFIAADEELADELLEAGLVQDPYLGEPLKLIGSDPGRRSGRYATRQLKAGEPHETKPETASATKPQQTPKPAPPTPEPTPTPPQPAPTPEPQPEQMPKPAPPLPDPELGKAPAARRGRPAKAK
jgi:outer membrane biosynthesis protein TonB